MPGKDQRDMKQTGSKSNGDNKSRDGRKEVKGGKGGKVLVDGSLHYDNLNGDEAFDGALDRGDPNYDLDGEVDALADSVNALKVGADSAEGESIFKPGANDPADLTAWTNPNGGTAAAEGEFKMDFEGKRETVDKERVAELVGQAQKDGRVDYKKVCNFSCITYCGLQFVRFLRYACPLIDQFGKQELHRRCCDRPGRYAEDLHQRGGC